MGKKLSKKVKECPSCNKPTLYQNRIYVGKKKTTIHWRCSKCSYSLTTESNFYLESKHLDPIKKKLIQKKVNIITMVLQGYSFEKICKQLDSNNDEIKRIIKDFGGRKLTNLGRDYKIYFANEIIQYYIKAIKPIKNENADTGIITYYKELFKNELSFILEKDKENILLIVEDSKLSTNKPYNDLCFSSKNMNFIKNWIKQNSGKKEDEINEDEINDIFKDSFIILKNKIKYRKFKLNERTNLNTYFIGICKNVCMENLRNEKKELKKYGGRFLNIDKFPL